MLTLFALEVDYRCGEQRIYEYSYTRMLGNYSRGGYGVPSPTMPDNDNDGVVIMI